MKERSLVRHEIALSAQTWVVKVGTNVLARADGTLDHTRIDTLAEQICAIAATGRKIALVSSGAVGAGIGQLELARRPESLPQVQAAAAVGQAFLIRAYDECFHKHGRHAAQILLTHEDFDDRARYLNVRNTLLALFDYQAVPIINENDTISVDEIKFGDNDRLAAMVANLLQAPLTVILSVVEGLYRSGMTSGMPPDIIDVVSEIDDSVLSLASAGRSQFGTGGMRSKLEAARLVTQAGGSVIIAPGGRPGVLTEILEGTNVGTLFLARGTTQAARRRWIGLTARPRGCLTVDQGARVALVDARKSLLAIGVKQITGTFEKGDVVSIQDQTGAEFARGLSNYSSSDAAQILGMRNDEVRKRLGTVYDEVIHRDNLVLVV